MADFTKGPWRHDGGAVFGDDGVDSSRMVANCTGYTRSKDTIFVLSQNEHNARLIAAAPDMYEALKSFMGADSKMQVNIGGNPSYVNRFLEAVKETLAKVDGKNA